MIKVGVFWISTLLTVDIIYDIEEYSEKNNTEPLVTYSKQHKDVWDKLSKEQYGGKYSSYNYNTLPRGRVWYDAEEKKYEVVFYRGSKDFINTMLPKIKELFRIEKADARIDVGLE